VPKRDMQNMDVEKIDWRHILSNHDDARDQLSRIFASGKTGTCHVEGNTGCNRLYLFIGFLSEMVVIANF